MGRPSAASDRCAAAIRSFGSLGICSGRPRPSSSNPATPAADGTLARRVAVLLDRYNGLVMHFEVVGEIEAVETFAVGRAIREIHKLRRRYGISRWRKRKGVGRVRLADGSIVRAELHWYEAHGTGRVEMKIKRFLDD